MSAEVCRVHRLAVDGECSACDRGVCPACAHRGRERLCPLCARERDDVLALAEMGRESRIAMRRAGVRVSRRRGEPVVLWNGPFRLAIPAAGAAGVAIAAAVTAAEARLRWGVEAELTVVALAVAVGAFVRMLFGGVSRQAGLVAALVVGVVALLADRLAGSAAPDTRPVAVLADVSDWVAAHGLAAGACVAVAAFLAYGAAAGRRLA